MRILKSHPLLRLVNSYIIDSPQPSNLSYLWNFGSLLADCLVIQIITGVTLAMHYNPSVLEAFNSVEHIMRDVNNGWLIRYLHSNTASAFFFIVYLHIGRGLYYGSYRAPRTLVWTIGTVIFILMMATAFLGYKHSPKWFKLNNNKINNRKNYKNKSSFNTFFKVDETTIGKRYFSTSSRKGFCATLLKNQQANKDAFAELPFANYSYEEFENKKNYSHEELENKNAFAELPFANYLHEELETVKEDNSKSDSEIVKAEFQTESSISSGNYSKSSGERDPFYLERYLININNLERNPSEDSYVPSESSLNSIPLFGSYRTSISSTLGSVWYRQDTINKMVISSSNNPSNDPSNDPSEEYDSDLGLGKFRLYPPSRNRGGYCKSMSTVPTTNTDSSDKKMREPLSIDINPFGSSKDDKELYKDQEYKGHDDIFNTFSSEEVKLINDQWKSNKLDDKGFYDLVDKKCIDIDSKTGLLKAEYLSDIENKNYDSSDIACILEDFDKLGEHDKDNVRYLADEMLSELKTNNELSYVNYKFICSACNFAYIEKEDKNFVTSSMIDPKEERKLWALDNLKFDISNFDEDTYIILGFLCIPFVLFILIVCLYDKYRNKNNKQFIPINNTYKDNYFVIANTFIKVKQTYIISKKNFSTLSKESYSPPYKYRQYSEELTKFIKEKNIKPIYIYENLSDNTIKTRVLNETRGLSGIYLILNKFTLDYYIGSGSTGKLYARFVNHLFNFNGSKVVKNAVKKYNISSFAFMILELFPEIINKENNKKLLDLEDFYLKSLLPNYNILTEAGSSFGYKHSEITRLKMKTNYSEERRMAIGNLNRNKNLSLSTIELIRESALNQTKSIYLRETVKNMKKNSKAILAYNLDYTVYGEFTSVIDAAKSLGCDRKTLVRTLQTEKKILRRRWILKFI